MADPDVKLEARLAEQDSFEPPADFVEQANVTDPDIYDEFESNWPNCWTQAADMLDWEAEYTEILDDSNPPFYEWFADGELNASANCLDRHLDERGDEAAIEWVGEPTDEDNRTYTYQELHDEVDALGAEGGSKGVEEDDIVTL